MNGSVLNDKEIQEIEQAHRHEWWVTDLVATIRDRDNKIAELRGLLKRCEWSAEVSGHWEEAGCPICGSWQGSERHEDDCELRQALEE